MKKHKSSKHAKTGSSNSTAEVFVLPPELLAKLGINLVNVQNSGGQSLEPCLPQGSDQNINTPRSLPDSRDTSSIIETANLMKESVFLSPTFLQPSSHVMPDEEPVGNNESITKRDVGPNYGSLNSVNTDGQNNSEGVDITPHLLMDNVETNPNPVIPMNPSINIGLNDSIEEYQVENQDGNLILTDVSYYNTVDANNSNTKIKVAVPFDEHTDEAYLSDCSNSNLACSPEDTPAAAVKQKLKRKIIRKLEEHVEENLQLIQLHDLLSPIDVSSMVPEEEIYSDLNIASDDKQAEIIITKEIIPEQPLIISSNSDPVQNIELLEISLENIISCGVINKEFSEIEIGLDGDDNSLINNNDAIHVQKQQKETKMDLTESESAQSLENNYQAKESQACIINNVAESSDDELLSNVLTTIMTQSSDSKKLIYDSESIENKSNEEKNHTTEISETNIYEKDERVNICLERDNDCEDNVKEIAAYLNQIANERRKALLNNDNNRDSKLSKTTVSPIKSKLHVHGVEKPGGELIHNDEIMCVDNKIALKTYQRTTTRKQTPVLNTKSDEVVNADIFQLSYKDDDISSRVETTTRESEFCNCYDFGYLAYYDCEMLYEHIHFWNQNDIKCDPELLYSIYNEDYVIPNPIDDFIEDCREDQYPYDDAKTSQVKICWNIMMSGRNNKNIKSGVSDSKISEENKSSIKAAREKSLPNSETVEDIVKDSDNIANGVQTRKRSAAAVDQTREQNGPGAKKKLKCGVCNQLMTDIEWETHKETKHNSIAWKAGQEIDIKNNNLLKTLRQKLKEAGYLTCSICKKQIKLLGPFTQHLRKCIKLKVTKSPERSISALSEVTINSKPTRRSTRNSINLGTNLPLVSAQKQSKSDTQPPASSSISVVKSTNKNADVASMTRKTFIVDDDLKSGHLNTSLFSKISNSKIDVPLEINKESASIAKNDHVRSSKTCKTKVSANTMGKSADETKYVPTKSISSLSPLVDSLTSVGTSSSIDNKAPLTIKNKSVDKDTSTDKKSEISKLQTRPSSNTDLDTLKSLKLQTSSETPLTPKTSRRLSKTGLGESTGSIEITTTNMNEIKPMKIINKSPKLTRFPIVSDLSVKGTESNEVLVIAGTKKTDDQTPKSTKVSDLCTESTYINKIRDSALKLCKSLPDVDTTDKNTRSESDDKSRKSSANENSTDADTTDKNTRSESDESSRKSSAHKKSTDADTTDKYTRSESDESSRKSSANKNTTDADRNDKNTRSGKSDESSRKNPPNKSSTVADIHTENIKSGKNDESTRKSSPNKSSIDVDTIDKHTRNDKTGQSSSKSSLNKSEADADTITENIRSGKSDESSRKSTPNKRSAGGQIITNNKRSGKSDESLTKSSSNKSSADVETITGNIRSGKSDDTSRKSFPNKKTANGETITENIRSSKSDESLRKSSSNKSSANAKTVTGKRSSKSEHSSRKSSPNKKSVVTDSITKSIKSGKIYESSGKGTPNKSSADGETITEDIRSGKSGESLRKSSSKKSLADAETITGKQNGKSDMSSRKISPRKTTANEHTITEMRKSDESSKQSSLNMNDGQPSLLSTETSKDKERQPYSDDTLNYPNHKNDNNANTLKIKLTNTEVCNKKSNIDLDSTSTSTLIKSVEFSDSVCERLDSHECNINPNPDINASSNSQNQTSITKKENPSQTLISIPSSSKGQSLKNCTSTKTSKLSRNVTNPSITKSPTAKRFSNTVPCIPPQNTSGMEAVVDPKQADGSSKKSVKESSSEIPEALANLKNIVSNADNNDQSIHKSIEVIDDKQEPDIINHSKGSNNATTDISCKSLKTEREPSKPRVKRSNKTIGTPASMPKDKEGEEQCILSESAQSLETSITDLAASKILSTNDSLPITPKTTVEVEIEIPLLTSGNWTKCGVCAKKIEDKQWIDHISKEHDYLAWRDGVTVLNLKDSEAVKHHLQVIANQNNGLVCSKCGMVRKFAKVFLRHIGTCKGNTKNAMDISTASVDLNSTQESDDDMPLSAKKSRKSLQRKSAIQPSVTCGVCKKDIENTAWIEHIRVEHKYLAWIDGDTPIDPDDEDQVKGHLNYISKHHGGLHCSKCGSKWSYVKKYLLHEKLCEPNVIEKAPEVPKIEVEIQPVVRCGVCKRNVEGKEWVKHILNQHQYVAWIDGETPLNVEDCEQMREHLNKILSISGELVCPNCGVTRKHVKPYQQHVTACKSTGYVMMKTEPVSVEKGKYECGVCHERGARVDWSNHVMTKHYNIGWMVGELPINLRNPYAVEKYLKEYQRKHSLTCKHCKATRSSCYGFYAHIMTCGKTEAEIDAVHDHCNICNNKYLCIYKNQHVAMHRDQEFRKERREMKALKAAEEAQKVPEPVVLEPIGKRKAARKAKKVIEKYASNIVDGKLVCGCGATFDNAEEMSEHPCEQKQINLDEESDVSVKIEVASEVSSDTDVESIVSNDEAEPKRKRKREGPRITRMSHRVSNYLSYLVNGYKDFCNLHYTTDNLFNLWRDRECELVLKDDMEKYLPSLAESCKVRFGDSDDREWLTYKRLESKKVKGYSMFTGGGIQCMSWAPHNIADETLGNYLAVSVHRGADVPRHGAGDLPTHPGLLQIWDFKQFNFLPICSLGLAHEYGIVWGMDWCPSGTRDLLPNGCSDQEIPTFRLGLLAIACSNGSAYILAVPYPPQADNNEVVMYKVKPVAELRLSMSPDRRMYQATSINWSQQKGHDIIIVGYSDGTTAIYDLNTESRFLKAFENNVTIYYPFQDKHAQNSSITGVGIWPSANFSQCIGGQCSTSITGGTMSGASGSPSVRSHLPISSCYYSALWPAVMLAGDALFTYKSVTEMEWWGGGRRLGSTRAGSGCLRCGRLAAVAAPAVRLLRAHPCYPELKKLIVATVVMAPIGQKRKLKANDNLSTVVKPLTYEDAVRKYGVQFCLVPKNEQVQAVKFCNENELTPDQFPLSDIVATAFCPAARFHDKLALGTHTGLIFIING